MKNKIPIFLLLSLSLFFAPQVAAISNCPPLTNSKVYWDGLELKSGQIGRLTVLQPTTLYKNDSGNFSSSRTLNTGERYRVYALKSDYYNVGGGFIVKKTPDIFYQTPSKAKLQQLSCLKQQSHVALHSSMEEIERTLGTPVKKLLNEFNTQTHVYHNNYQKFYSINYLERKAAAIYTKDPDFKFSGVRIGDTLNAVREKLGTKYESIGNTAQREILKYRLADQTAYIYLDIHDSNRVTAFYLLSNDLLNRNKGLYPEDSSIMQSSYETLLFELTNSERKAKGLKTLVLSSQATESARLHSKDMSENDFFSHDNLKGESPFDRMKNIGIKYRYAGENIAMGYTNPYFAHEALMNSIGHRKNILSPNYTHLGIGVDFALWDYGAIPYYTENFYTP